MAQAGEFVAFLPGDNQDLANPNTHAVIELINQDLSQLLRLLPQQFWQVVLTDKSLHTCLDSFLRFRRRCYDDSAESIQGSSDLLLQLSQRVFRVFWRMAHPQNEQQQQHSAAGSSKQQPPQPQQISSPAKIAEQLYNNWLIDVPNMLDIAVLYGPGNAELTGQLLGQLLQLQPRYAQDIVSLAEPLSGNLHELAENVKRLADKVLKGKGSSEQTEQLLNELAEAVRYFLDAFLTLQAFVECLPQAAALLLHPNNHGSVLLALAVIYSSVVPALQRIVQQPEAATVQGLRSGPIQQLQQCIVSLVFQIVRSAFCTAAGAAAAAAAGDSAPYSTSSSSRQGTRLSAGKGLKQQQQQQGFSAELQGQDLMNLLMLLAHPSDHTYGGSSGSSMEVSFKGGLLAAVNHTYHLDVAVAAAVEQGLLALDDAQFDYLLALVDGDRDLLQQRKKQQQQQASASTSQSPAAAAAAAAGSSSGVLPQDLTQKIQSIRELLPDYGDGFLTAVLYHSSWNAEEAINCLLEGSLPKAVQGLDPSLKTWVPPSSDSSTSQASSSAAAAAGGSSSSSGLSWTGLAREAAAAATPPAAAQIPLPSLEAAAAAGPKPQIDRRTGRILGALPSQVRSVTKNMAYELQYEYDDEYDDSFDDLIGPGNDGVCDIEGEDSTADLPGPNLSQRSGTVRPSLAAAAAGTADIYADEPSSSSRGPQQRQQQQHEQRGRQQKGGKLWVLDGKVYNYKKEGAVEVAGQEGAQKALQAAKQAAHEIYGLGPGGNVPLAVDTGDQPRQQDKQHGSTHEGSGRRGGGQGDVGAAAAATAVAAALGAGRGEGLGAGAREGYRGGGASGGRGGRGRGATADDGASTGSGGRGRGRGGYAHKEQHKSAVANHHRKDRATAKQAKGMF